MFNVEIQKVTQPPEFTPEACTHLWLLDLTQLNAASIEAQEYILTPEELARAKANKRTPLASTAIRIFLRRSLAPYYHTPPESLVFKIHEKGKPFITNTESQISFNLSHTREVAILAVSQGNLIGVDIEKTKRQVDILGIAKNYFNESELKQLQQQAAHTQMEFFFKLWTLKEAFVKATGDGISLGLEKVSFNLYQNNIKLALTPELGRNAKDWQFHQQLIRQDLCLAIAKEQSTKIKPLWLQQQEA
jgi:4'-phosphopantetheinyl transferase